MKNISCMAAAESAMHRTVATLFKPFNFVTWLMLGLCAWLTQIGADMGVWVNETVKFILNQYVNEDKEAVAAAMQSIAKGDLGAIKDIVDIDGLLAINPLWYISGIIIITLLAVLLLWIRSQAQLIFLDNLIHKTRRFTASLKENFHLGNSIFLWQVLYFIISPTIIFTAAALPLLLSLNWIKGCIAAKALSMPNAAAISGFVLSLVITIILSLTFKLLVFFFEEFMVPIILIRRQNAFKAMMTFAKLFKYYTFTFVKYALLYLALAIAAGTLVIIVVICTCCMAGLLLMIPYVSALVMLPLLVFFRLFGLELLNQMYKHKIL